MRNMGIVRGSKESAVPFYVCVDTVFLRFNIEPVPPKKDPDGMTPTGEQYQYHEIQYSLREWLQVLTESVIDTASFALNTAQVEALNTLTADNGEAIMAAEQAYIGRPEQKPFTFDTRFTPRRG